jgi:excisionase family DNA binding protein
MLRDKREFLHRDQLLMPWSPGRTVSVKSAAKHIGCCETTIREMIDKGELKGYKIRPKSKNSPYRVLVYSIEKHIGRVIDTYQLDCRR